MTTEIIGDRIESTDILMFKDKQVGPVSLLDLLKTCCSQKDDDDDTDTIPTPPDSIDMAYSPYVYRFNVDQPASRLGTHPDGVTNESQFTTSGDSLEYTSFRANITNTSKKGWSKFTFYPGTGNPDETKYPKGMILGIMTTFSKTVKMPTEANAAIVSYNVPISWGYSGLSVVESIRTMGMNVRMKCEGDGIRFPAKGTFANQENAFSRGCSNVLSLSKGTSDAFTADERANRQWYRISTVIVFDAGAEVTFTGFADAVRLGRSKVSVGAGEITIQPYKLSTDELGNNFGTVTATGRSTVADDEGISSLRVMLIMPISTQLLLKMSIKLSRSSLTSTLTTSDVLLCLWKHVGQAPDYRTDWRNSSY